MSTFQENSISNSPYVRENFDQSKRLYNRKKGARKEKAKENRMNQLAYNSLSALGFTLFGFFLAMTLNQRKSQNITCPNPPVNSSKKNNASPEEISTLPDVVSHALNLDKKSSNLSNMLAHLAWYLSAIYGLKIATSLIARLYRNYVRKVPFFSHTVDSMTRVQFSAQNSGRERAPGNHLRTSGSSSPLRMLSGKTLEVTEAVLRAAGKAIGKQVSSAFEHRSDRLALDHDPLDIDGAVPVSETGSVASESTNSPGTRSSSPSKRTFFQSSSTNGPGTGTSSPSSRTVPPTSSTEGSGTGSSSPPKRKLFQSSRGFISSLTGKENP